MLLIKNDPDLAGRFDILVPIPGLSAVTAFALLIDMSRQDIADYLGLTIETVSRVVTKLKERSVIVLRDARTIDIVRMDALRLLCN